MKSVVPTSRSHSGPRPEGAAGRDGGRVRVVAAISVALFASAGVVVFLLTGRADSPPQALTGAVGASPSAAVGPSLSPSATSWSVSGVPDVCRTITAPEVSAILGVTVAEGIDTASWPSNCAFALPGAQKEYLYTMDTSAATARDDFTRERKSAKTTEAVSGLGDQAYWIPDTTELNVLIGKTYVVVKFGGSTPPARAKEKAIALGRITVPRSVPGAKK